MNDEPRHTPLVEGVAPDVANRQQPQRAASSPWLTAEEAAERARCGVKVIYREVRTKRLRAARIGGRRELRLLPEWVDQWLLESSNVRPS